MLKDKKKIIKISILIIFIIIIVAIISIFVYNRIEKNKEPKLITIEEEINDFEGEKISGIDVKLLIAQLINHDLVQDISQITKIEYNIKKIDNEELNGKINFNSNEVGGYLQELVDLRNSIDKEATYKIEYGKENGKIVSIKIEN